MGASTPVILRVSAPEHGRVIVDAADGMRYHADLSVFAGVCCFPLTEHEWRQITIDSYGLGLVWSNRFEVHADQIVALAHLREPLPADQVDATR